MPNRCCVHGCNGTSSNENRFVSYHKFPKQQNLIEQWLHAIDRPNFSPSNSTRICSFHFLATDFITERNDNNLARKKKRPFNLQKRYLKEGIIPSVLIPRNERQCQNKHTNALSERRQNLENNNILSQIKTFETNDLVTSTNQIVEKLRKCDTTPSGFTYLQTADKLHIIFVDVSSPCAKLQGCIYIDLDLSAVVYINNFEMALKDLGIDMVINNKINRLSQVFNLMAAVKAQCANVEEKASSFLASAVASVHSFYKKSENQSEELLKKILFIVDQIELLNSNKHVTVKYSSNLVMFAYSLYATSSTAYRHMLKIKLLTLPCISTLSRITRTLGNSDITNKYLSLRVSKLPSHEKQVTLMFDEIYISRQVQYSNGKVISLQNGTVSSTALCFMVKSILGKYKDVVGIYPVAILNNILLKSYVWDILKNLHSCDLKVSVILADNASSNRALLRSLLNNFSKTSFEDPNDPSRRIFAIFDPVHNFKNIYNNFQARTTFVYPSIMCSSTSSVQCCANFNHIEQLYNCELGMPVKIAYKLTSKVINPHALEKTSVKLSAAVFDESTCNALDFYSSQYTAWRETSDFIKYINCFWKILNVKTPSIGIHKRDDFRLPIFTAQDNNFKFLTQFITWLDIWQKAQTPGLSSQTFLALSHTCRGLRDIILHMLETEKLHYVLLGTFQSDPIERRFGWYRQMSGGNYLIGLKQILDSEKKIRALSLVKFSHFTITDFHSLNDNSSKISDSDTIIVNNILGEIGDCNKPGKNDAAIVFYIAGYISRSICKRYKCQFCKSVLVKNNQQPTVAFDHDTWTCAKQFLAMLNRGGLCEPSDLVFLLCLQFWTIYQCIFHQSHLKVDFLAASNHATVFKSIVKHVLKDLYEATKKCVNNHSQMA